MLFRSTPTGSLAPDSTVTPDVINNIDLAQNWVNLQNAWGTQWGNWELLNRTFANTLITASNSVSQHVASNPLAPAPAPNSGGTSGGPQPQPAGPAPWLPGGSGPHGEGAHEAHWNGYTWV